MKRKMEPEGAGNKYSEEACEVRLSPSRAFAAMIALAAAATLALLAATPGSAALRILAATWVSCAALEALHARALLRGSHAVRCVRLRRGGEIEVLDGRGRRREGVVRPGSFVAPWLTIVRWRAHGSRLAATVPILPGMAAEEDLRRLRIMLRWS